MRPRKKRKHIQIPIFKYFPWCITLNSDWRIKCEIKNNRKIDYSGKYGMWIAEMEPVDKSGRVLVDYKSKLPLNKNDHKITAVIEICMYLASTFASKNIQENLCHTLLVPTGNTQTTPAG